MSSPITMKLPNGFTLTAFPHSEFIVNEIWDEHYYDSDHSIEPGSVVIDLGANQGIFSLYAASKGAVVYAVEPNPENFALLTKNINDNHLSKQIVALNYAVGTTPGDITLFVPRTDRTYGGGLVTASRAQLEAVEGLPGTVIESISCPSITLATLLASHVPSGIVDLLKIDCEGAELDILSSAAPTELNRIQNMVLETHRAYAEKDLCRTITDVGFTITNYRKVAGRMLPSGYLFATKNKPSVSYSRPVAVLEAPAIVQTGQEMLLDASSSFSLRSAAKDLIFRWRIGDEAIEGSSSTLLYKTVKDGAHTISVTVVDDDAMDSSEKRIWCRPTPLPATGEIHSLGKIKELDARHVDQSGILHYVIRKDAFAELWDYEYESITIGIHSVGAEFVEDAITCSDGEEVWFSEGYRELRFRRYPPNEDLHFSLNNLRHGAVVATSWWIEGAQRELPREMKRPEPVSIGRTYRFPDFSQAFAFVTRVCELGENHGHHPNITLEWGKARVAWTTYDPTSGTKSVSKLDEELAAETEKIFAYLNGESAAART